MREEDVLSTAAVTLVMPAKHIHIRVCMYIYIYRYSFAASRHHELHTNARQIDRSRPARYQTTTATNRVYIHNMVSGIGDVGRVYCIASRSSIAHNINTTNYRIHIYKL